MGTCRPESLRIWISHPRNRTNIQSDLLILTLLTIVTAGLAAVCLLGEFGFLYNRNTCKAKRINSIVKRINSRLLGDSSVKYFVQCYESRIFFEFVRDAFYKKYNGSDIQEIFVEYIHQFIIHWIILPKNTFHEKDITYFMSLNIDILQIFISNIILNNLKYQDCIAMILSCFFILIRKFHISFNYLIFIKDYSKTLHY